MKFAIAFAALLATVASPVVARSAPNHNRSGAALSVKNANSKRENTRHARNDDRGRGNHGGHGRDRDRGHNNGHNGGHGGGHHGGGNSGHHGGGHHCHGDCDPVSP